MPNAQFETGATNAASNNLVLSVLKDDKVYDERIHAAKRLLQGQDPIRSFRDIITSEANNQRQHFGDKFKPQEITEAAKIIQKESINNALELIRDKYEAEGKPTIAAYCRRWFDKVNGNSYFSVNLIIAGNAINIPFQYGYGSQWQYEVIDLLEKYGFIPKIPYYENGNKNYGRMSDYEREGIIHWEDQRYGLKRQMFDGLYL